MAALLLSKDGKGSARTIEGAHEVDVHHAPHRLRRRFLHGAVVAEAGVTDHDVEPAERGACPFDERRHLGLDRHVHREELGTTTAGADAIRRLAEPVFAPCPKHHRGAGARELLRASEPDACRRAGDHRRTPRKIHERIIGHSPGARGSGLGQSSGVQEFRS